MLQPGSLLVFCEPVYSSWLHAIEPLHAEAVPTHVLNAKVGQAVPRTKGGRDAAPTDEAIIGCSCLPACLLLVLLLVVVQEAGVSPGDVMERKGVRTSLTIRRALGTCTAGSSTD